MKKLIIILALALPCALAPTGCKTPPSARVVEVQTLKSIGLAAKTSMDAATTLLKGGQITVPQWQAIANIYDNKFQPAFTLAVATAQSDLSSVASPDLINLATQLASIIATYVPSK